MEDASQMGVKSAFLNEKLEEEIYVRQSIKELMFSNVYVRCVMTLVEC